MKKAQTALEFLVTYGWAILLILITVGVLIYYGLLDMNKYMSDYCNFGPQLECKDYSLSTNEIDVQLSNNFGFPVQIINYTVIVDGIPRASFNNRTPTSDVIGEVITPGKCLPIKPQYTSTCIGLDASRCINDYNSYCVWIPGFIDLDENYALNTSQWNMSGSLNLPQNRKKEIDIVMYFRRINPKYANTPTPIHKLRGAIFTNIKP